MKTKASTMHEVSLEWDLYVQQHNEKKNERYTTRPTVKPISANNPAAPIPTA